MSILLTEYRQQIEDSGSTTPYMEMRFDGLAPVLVQQRRQQRVLRQSGRALTWGLPMVAPACVIVNPVYLERPEIRYEKVSVTPLKWETTWNYTVAIDDGQAIDLIAWQAWPLAPEFKS
ncbi:MAG TPA: hypothetical protein VGB55_02295 [Tepidisphaeraceae bacterium]|jgi:hypothetical protein